MPLKARAEKGIKMENQIYSYLQAVLGKYRVSDFHLHAGRPLSVRVNGVIQHFDDMVISHDDLEQLLLKELDNDSHHKFI